MKFFGLEFKFNGFDIWHKGNHGSGSGLDADKLDGKHASEFATLEYVASRGENLVTNGTGLLGNNSNFSTFAFDGSDAYFSKGSFKDSTYTATRYNDEVMPVDVNKTYKLEVSAKTNPYVGAKYYIGVSEFDADGYAILAYHHMYFANTLTTLAQDLKVGDTKVYLTSSANWKNAQGSNTHQRSIIFWGYTNSFGYTFPPETYSRYYSSYDMWLDGAVDYANNYITLKNPWSYTNPKDPGGIWRAGQQLSNGNSGGNYKYIALSNGIIPNAWTKYNGNIGTVDNSGDNVYNKFSHGTAGVKLLFLNNREVSSSTVWYSNISFYADYMTGNASTATKLQNTRTINDVNFDGTQNIIITANPNYHAHTKSDITDFPSLATVATSGSYTDLSNKPTIPTTLPANGGNADTVDNKHASDFAPSGYGLGGLCKSVTGDWNSYTDTGFYMGSALTNSPPATNGSNSWWYVLIMTHNTSPGWTLQLATDFNNKATYRRAKVNGSWSSWTLLYTTDNKPSPSDIGAAPASHSHTKSQITDMPTKLSDFTNDIGAGGGIKITTSATAPSSPSPSDFWYKEI